MYLRGETAWSRGFQPAAAITLGPAGGGAGRGLQRAGWGAAAECSAVQSCSTITSVCCVYFAYNALNNKESAYNALDDKEYMQGVRIVKCFM